MLNAIAVKRLDTLQRFVDPNQLCLAQDQLTMFKTQKFLQLFMMKDATRDPILITLELNEISLQMELDTRASLALIHRISYKINYS